MNCDAARPQLTALVDGELPPSTAAQIEAHLAECAECAEAAREIRALSRLADRWLTEEHDIADAVRQKITGHEAAQDPPQRVCRRHRGLLVAGKGAIDILLEKYIITAAQLAQAKDIQKITRAELGNILIHKGFATERDVAQATAEADGLPFLDVTRHEPEVTALATVPEEIVRTYRALPYKKDGQRLWVAMADVRDFHAVETIRRISDCPVVTPMMAARTDLLAAIERTFVRSKNSATLPEMAALLTEIREMREEMRALRGEVARLREELTVRPYRPATPYAPPKVLLPYAPPEDTPRPLM